MKKTKKLIAMLLAVMMLLSIMPMAVFAETTPNYLYVTNIGNVEATLYWGRTGSPGISIQYSKDRSDFKDLIIDGKDGTKITLKKGETVYFKGDYSSAQTGSSKYIYLCSECDDEYAALKVGGDLTTLLDGKGNVSSLSGYSSYLFAYLFRGLNQSLVDASELWLPSTTLATSCYMGMFSSCILLETAPQLPATTIAERCYDSMFKFCKSLETAPQLPATVLQNNCYNSMFYGCELLETAPQLPATTLRNTCYCNMFNGCKGLKSITVGFSDFAPQGITNPTGTWLNNTSTSGTIIVPKSLTDPASRTATTIPNGWDIVKLDLYNITNALPRTAAEINNGYLTVDKVMGSNEDIITVTVTPAEDYMLTEGSLLVKYNDNGEKTITPTQQDEQDATKYSFTMPAADVTVTAEFEEIPTHTHSFTGEYVSNGDGTYSRKCTGCDEVDTVNKITVTDYHTITKTCDSFDGKGGLMGRQFKNGDANVGRTIIGLTAEQLADVGDKLVIVGGDLGKQTTFSLDCAYTYFYNGETKITAESMSCAAFIIIDADAEGSSISGYGYYRIYNGSAETENNFMFDTLNAAPVK